MKKSWVLLFIIVFVLNLNAQSWVKQNSGTTNNLWAIYFLNPDTGWVTGDGGTVLKTVDGGQTWSDKSLGVLENMGSCFFVNSNLGWVGGSYGLYKTTDGGDSWTQQTGPSNIKKIFFFDQSTGWTVGGTYGTTSDFGQIFLTTDGGDHWTEEKNSTHWSMFNGVQFIDKSTGWVSSGFGFLIKATDGGSVWQSPLYLKSGMGIGSMYFIDKNTGFAVGRDNNGGSIYKTVDGGTSWIDKAPGMPYSPGYIKFFNANNGIVAGGAYFGQPAVLVTSDGGENWTTQITSVPDGASSGSFLSEYFVDNNTGWAVGGSGSILKFEMTTSVEDIRNPVPKDFSLEQNYPNPFNPTTVINYSLPKASHVSIKVYDMLGKEVTELVKETKKAGRYSILFSTLNYHLASGIYFYQLKTDEYVSMKKMILMK